MVRETRHLWVGNLPENVREDGILEHFKRYGRVQSIKILPKKDDDPGVSATVAFIDIKSAAKAHSSENKFEERTLKTDYYEPSAPSTASSAIHIHEREESLLRETRHSHGGHYSSTRTSRYPLGQTEERGYDRPSHYYERPDRDPYLRRSIGYHDEEVYQDRSRPRERYKRGSYPSTSERTQGHYRSHSARHHYDQQHYPSDQYLDERESLLGKSSSRRTLSSHSVLKHAGTSRTRSPCSRSRSASGGSRSSSGSRSTSSSSGSRTSSSDSSSHSRSPSRSWSTSLSVSVSSKGSCKVTKPTTNVLNSSASSPHPSPLRPPEPQESQTITQIETNTQESNSNSKSQEEKRPLGICIKNLPARSSDTSLKDGLYHEYKKHGKVTAVKLIGQGTERYAVVCFKKPEDVEKALEVSQDKLFFGCKIDVTAHEGLDVEDNEFRPYEAELDEYHPKATRTLFIGNLEKGISMNELQKHFEVFGEIIEIDIKKQGVVTSYAFVQYADIISVAKGMRKMDGEHLGANRIKLGFGKSMPTSCVWLDGIAESVSEKFLSRQFSRYGPVVYTVIDKNRGLALVFYDNVECAQIAVMEMKGRALAGKKLQIDFASRECQNAFFEKMEQSGQQIPVGRPWERSLELRDFDVREDRYRSERDSRSSFDAHGRCYGRFENQRNRGNYRSLSRGNYRGRGRGYSDRFDGYREDYLERRQGNYDEYSQGSGASFEDSYEQELREYGFSQRERREYTSADRSLRGKSYSPHRRRDDRSISPHPRNKLRDCSLSPPRDRSRYEKYERTRDRYENSKMDLSGDSVYNEKHSRTKSYDEKCYLDKDTLKKKKHHSISPPGSFSQSPPRYKSRSYSPPSKEKHSRKDKRPGRPRTPTSPPPESPPESMDYKRGGDKTLTMDTREVQKRLDYKPDICDFRKTESDVDYDKIRTKSDSERIRHKKVCRNIVDDSKLDSNEQFERRKRHLDETVCRENSPTHCKIVQTPVRSRSPSSSQSHKPKIQEVVENIEKRKLEPDQPIVVDKSQKGVTEEHSDEGSSQECWEKTSSTDSGKDLKNLQKEKVHILHLLEQLDDGVSSSDTEIVSNSEDIKKRLKKPKLSDVFDLVTESSRRRQKELSKEASINKECRITDSQRILDLSSGKFKPIDTTLGYRKQMEARKALEQQNVLISSQNEKKKTETLVILNTDEDDEITTLDIPPKEISTEFLPKKRRKHSLSGEKDLTKRSYRTKHSSDEQFSGCADKEVTSGEKSCSSTSPVIPNSVPSTGENPFELKREDTLSLPLPKFALHSSKQSPRPGMSPKPLSSPLSSPVSSKIVSPMSGITLPKSDAKLMMDDVKIIQISQNSVIEKSDGLPNRNMNYVISSKLSHLKADDDSLSDSDFSPSDSPSLDERIRALDKKFNAWNGPNRLSTETSIGSTVGYAPVDYQKYNIKKKPRSNLSLESGSLISNEIKTEPSDIAKALLAKSSIIDQDSKRLEHINEKYEPKEILNLDLTSKTKFTGIRTKAAAKEFLPSIMSPTLRSNQQSPSSRLPFSSSSSISYPTPVSSPTVPTSQSSPGSYSFHATPLSVPPPRLSTIISSLISNQSSKTTDHKNSSSSRKGEISKSCAVRESLATTVTSPNVTNSVNKKNDCPSTATPILKYDGSLPNSKKEVILHSIIKKDSKDNVNPPKKDISNNASIPSSTSDHSAKKRTLTVDNGDCELNKTKNESKNETKLDNKSKLECSMKGDVKSLEPESKKPKLDKEGSSSNLSGNHNKKLGKSSSKSFDKKSSNSNIKLVSKSPDKKIEDKERKEDDCKTSKEKTKHKDKDKGSSSSKSKESKYISNKSQKERSSSTENKGESSKSKPSKSSDSKVSEGISESKSSKHKQSKDKDRQDKGSRGEKTKSETKSERKLESNKKDTKAEKVKNELKSPFFEEEPVYLSMYDKVKARSNQDKREKDKEKGLADVRNRFSKLKESRAKRDEKLKSIDSDEETDESDVSTETESQKSKTGKGKKKHYVLKTSSDDGDFTSKEDDPLDKEKKSQRKSSKSSLGILSDSDSSTSEIKCKNKHIKLKQKLQEKESKLNKNKDKQKGSKTPKHSKQSDDESTDSKSISQIIKKVKHKSSNSSHKDIISEIDDSDTNLSSVTDSNQEEIAKKSPKEKEHEETDGNISYMKSKTEKHSKKKKKESHEDMSSASSDSKKNREDKKRSRKELEMEDSDTCLSERNKKDRKNKKLKLDKDSDKDDEMPIVAIEDSTVKKQNLSESSSNLDTNKNDKRSKKHKSSKQTSNDKERKKGMDKTKKEKEKKIDYDNEIKQKSNDKKVIEKKNDNKELKFECKSNDKKETKDKIFDLDKTAFDSEHDIKISEKEIKDQKKDIDTEIDKKADNEEFIEMKNENNNTKLELEKNKSIKDPNVSLVIKKCLIRSSPDHELNNNLEEEKITSDEGLKDCSVTEIHCPSTITETNDCIHKELIINECEISKALAEEVIHVDKNEHLELESFEAVEVKEMEIHSPADKVNEEVKIEKGKSKLDKDGQIEVSEILKLEVSTKDLEETKSIKSELVISQPAVASENVEIKKVAKDEVLIPLELDKECQDTFADSEICQSDEIKKENPIKEELSTSLDQSLNSQTVEISNNVCYENLSIQLTSANADSNIIGDELEKHLLDNVKEGEDIIKTDEKIDCNQNADINEVIKGNETARLNDDHEANSDFKSENEISQVIKNVGNERKKLENLKVELEPNAEIKVEHEKIKERKKSGTDTGKSGRKIKKDNADSFLKSCKSHTENEENESVNAGVENDTIVSDVREKKIEPKRETKFTVGTSRAEKRSRKKSEKSSDIKAETLTEDFGSVRQEDSGQQTENKNSQDTSISKPHGTKCDPPSSQAADIYDVYEFRIDDFPESINSRLGNKSSLLRDEKHHRNDLLSQEKADNQKREMLYSSFHDNVYSDHVKTKDSKKSYSDEREPEKIDSAKIEVETSNSNEKDKLPDLKTETLVQEPIPPLIINIPQRSRRGRKSKAEKQKEAMITGVSNSTSKQILEPLKGSNLESESKKSPSMVDPLLSKSPEPMLNSHESKSEENELSKTESSGDKHDFSDLSVFESKLIIDEFKDSFNSDKISNLTSNNINNILKMDSSCLEEKKVEALILEKVKNEEPVLQPEKRRRGRKKKSSETLSSPSNVEEKKVEITSPASHENNKSENIKLNENLSSSETMSQVADTHVPEMSKEEAEMASQETESAVADLLKLSEDPNKQDITEEISLPEQRPNCTEAKDNLGNLQGTQTEDDRIAIEATEEKPFVLTIPVPQDNINEITPLSPAQKPSLTINLGQLALSKGVSTRSNIDQTIEDVVKGNSINAEKDNEITPKRRLRSTKLRIEEKSVPVVDSNQGVTSPRSVTGNSNNNLIRDLEPVVVLTALSDSVSSKIKSDLKTVGFCGSSSKSISPTKGTSINNMVSSHNAFLTSTISQTNHCTTVTSAIAPVCSLGSLKDSKAESVEIMPYPVMGSASVINTELSEQKQGNDNHDSPSLSNPVSENDTNLPSTSPSVLPIISSNVTLGTDVIAEPMPVLTTLPSNPSTSASEMLSCAQDFLSKVSSVSLTATTNVSTNNQSEKKSTYSPITPITPTSISSPQTSPLVSESDSSFLTSKTSVIANSSSRTTRSSRAIVVEGKNLRTSLRRDSKQELGIETKSCTETKSLTEMKANTETKFGLETRSSDLSAKNISSITTRHANALSSVSGRSASQTTIGDSAISNASLVEETTNKITTRSQTGRYGRTRAATRSQTAASNSDLLLAKTIPEGRERTRISQRTSAKFDNQNTTIEVEQSNTAVSAKVNQLDMPICAFNNVTKEVIPKTNSLLHDKLSKLSCENVKILGKSNDNLHESSPMDNSVATPLVKTEKTKTLDDKCPSVSEYKPDEVNVKDLAEAVIQRAFKNESGKCDTLSQSLSSVFSFDCPSQDSSGIAKLFSETKLKEESSSEPFKLKSHDLNSTIASCSDEPNGISHVSKINSSRIEQNYDTAADQQPEDLTTNKCHDVESKTYPKTDITDNINRSSPRILITSSADQRSNSHSTSVVVSSPKILFDIQPNSPRIISTQTTPEQLTISQLKVCSVPSPKALSITPGPEQQKGAPGEFIKGQPAMPEVVQLSQQCLRITNQPSPQQKTTGTSSPKISLPQQSPVIVQQSGYSLPPFETSLAQRISPHIIEKAYSHGGGGGGVIADLLQGQPYNLQQRKEMLTHSGSQILDHAGNPILRTAPQLHPDIARLGNPTPPHTPPTHPNVSHISSSEIHNSIHLRHPAVHSVQMAPPDLMINLHQHLMFGLHSDIRQSQPHLDSRNPLQLNSQRPNIQPRMMYKPVGFRNQQQYLDIRPQQSEKGQVSTEQRTSIENTENKSVTPDNKIQNSAERKDSVGEAGPSSSPLMHLIKQPQPQYAAQLRQPSPQYSQERLATSPVISTFSGQHRMPFTIDRVPQTCNESKSSQSQFETRLNVSRGPYSEGKSESKVGNLPPDVPQSTHYGGISLHGQISVPSSYLPLTMSGPNSSNRLGPDINIQYPMSNTPVSLYQDQLSAVRGEQRASPVTHPSVSSPYDVPISAVQSQPGSHSIGRTSHISQQPSPSLSDSHSGSQIMDLPGMRSSPHTSHHFQLLLQNDRHHPVMWRGWLALKNDQAVVSMHFVAGDHQLARFALYPGSEMCEGGLPSLRIAQRMRLEPSQLDGVARKMQVEGEHCMLLALPFGREPVEFLQQSSCLKNAFITYLQQKQAAGIVNVHAPGSQQPAYVVHIFPPCDFSHENLARSLPELLHNVTNLAYLLIVIATV